MSPRIPLDRDRIAEFCRRWQVTEFAVFGSVLRDDFRPDSDIDVLVTFDPSAPWSAFEEALFARRVDLVEREAVRNPIRRRAMLQGHEVIYAA